MQFAGAPLGSMAHAGMHTRLAGHRIYVPHASWHACLNTQLRYKERGHGCLGCTGQSFEQYTVKSIVGAWAHRSCSFKTHVIIHALPCFMWRWALWSKPDVERAQEDNGK
jgi:hypothetical protein